MSVPADTGIAGHGDCEPGSHSLGAQGHGVLVGKFLSRNTHKHTLRKKRGAVSLRYCGKFLCRYFRFPLSVSFHQCSVLNHPPNTDAI